MAFTLGEKKKTFTLKALSCSLNKYINFKCQRQTRKLSFLEDYGVPSPAAPAPICRKGGKGCVTQEMCKGHSFCTGPRRSGGVPLALYSLFLCLAEPGKL